jgi:hypothetical protein
LAFGVAIETNEMILKYGNDEDIFHWGKTSKVVSKSGVTAARSYVLSNVFIS